MAGTPFPDMFCPLITPKDAQTLTTIQQNLPNVHGLKGNPLVCNVPGTDMVVPCPPGGFSTGTKGVVNTYVYGPNPPPNMALSYLGASVIRDPGEVNAGSGFELVIPADQIWLLNWVGVDWVTNASANRFFVVRAFDNDGDLFYINGRNKPGDNSGGPLTFAVNTSIPFVTQTHETEALPPNLWLYPGWTVLIQMGNAGADDTFNSVRWFVEKWEMKPLQAVTVTPQIPTVFNQPNPTVPMYWRML